MTFNLLTEVVGLVCGGGLGAFAVQLYNAKINKKKIATEVANTQAEVDKKKLDNKQDAFETLYNQLNKCLSDYTEISEKYREHHERMRKYEEEQQAIIQEKCIELASMKAKITYLMGIRCYNSLCQNRITESPNKLIEEEIDNVH